MTLSLRIRTGCQPLPRCWSQQYLHDIGSSVTWYWITFSDDVFTDMFTFRSLRAESVHSIWKGLFFIHVDRFVWSLQWPPLTKLKNVRAAKINTYCGYVEVFGNCSGLHFGFIYLGWYFVMCPSWVVYCNRMRFWNEHNI